MNRLVNNNYSYLTSISIVLSAEKWTGIERPCLCQEFRCNDGIFCLDKSKICNGEKDCPSGEDELLKEHGKCRPPINQTCR